VTRNKKNKTEEVCKHRHYHLEMVYSTNRVRRDDLS